MFYLFILESIGTSELLLIGLTALIIFGPRKLPQMMRTIGKTMAEFRRSTEDFKRTWEKEANFGDDEYSVSENSDVNFGNQLKIENSIGRTTDLGNDKINVPEIREVSRDDFTIDIPKIEAPNEKAKEEISVSDKRNWL